MKNITSVEKKQIIERKKNGQKVYKGRNRMRLYAHWPLPSP